MPKDLIIVESPAKVKTIRKFLGKTYLVEASVGHVRDLPRKKLGVDPEKGFQPEYQVMPSKKKVVSTLKKVAKSARTIYLAPDPDREGEAIAWHIAQLLQDVNEQIKRIQFNEITRAAVHKALETPRDLNEDLFFSQQARRILDRLVGYKISPLLWKKVKRGISAGRVQSVALRLIVERERERQKFVPEEYWPFKARVQGKHPPDFWIELWKISGKKARVSNEKKALALAKELQAHPFVIQEIQEKEREKKPKPPFITSSLQQEASSRLGFSAKKTMMLAQQLYEGLELGDQGTTALITYMRTDSVRVAKEAQISARELIGEQFGSEYLPKRIRQFKVKSAAQDAHEAIRPVDVRLVPKDLQQYLPKDLFRLYRLIWERFVASQMQAARFWDTLVTVVNGLTLWRAKGERLIFPGFLKVYSGAGGNNSQDLPHLQPEETLNLLKLEFEQKFTQPPGRYSEAGLVRKLEENGIGRPSTYAQIISTLLDRDYVRRESRQLKPTELGMVVNDLLVSHFTKLMDVAFTAQMEGDLDRVALGELNWKDLLQRFWKEFESVLHKAEEDMAQVKAGLSSGLTCPQCGQDLLIKFGRHGEFLACKGYPECDYTTNFTRDAQGKIVIVEDAPQEQKVVGTCPECQGDLILKRSRTGSRFIACTNYPKCKYTQSFSTGVPCPETDCPGELVEKSSRRGKVFYACNQYPACKYALWYYPVQGTCPECGHKVLVRKESKTRGQYLACPVKGCKFWQKIEED